MAEPGEHPADFAVLTLGQDHFEDRREPLMADDPHALGANLALGEPDALRQLVEDLSPGLSGDDDAVDLLDAELGVGELVGEFAVIGQEQEAHALLVETAHRVDALGDLGQEVDDAGFARGVVVRRDIAFRLVDREVDQPLALNSLAIDIDARLVGIDTGSEFADDLSVDRHAPLGDQFFASPARADSGVRQDFLEPFRSLFRGFRRGLPFAVLVLRGSRVGSSRRSAGVRAASRRLPFPGRGSSVCHVVSLLKPAAPPLPQRPALRAPSSFRSATAPPSLYYPDLAVEVQGCRQEEGAPMDSGIVSIARSSSP